MTLNILVGKLKDNISAVVPIVIFVLVLHFTLVPLDGAAILRFMLGAILLIIGLSLFHIGVDLGITPLGSQTGSALVKTNRLPVVLGAGIVLGFLVSIAEPGLLVLADQIELVTTAQIPRTVILVVAPLGLGIMVALGFLRIVYDVSLRTFLLITYAVITILSLFVSPEFFSIAFDASGAATGIIAVPFILALALGVSGLREDSVASEQDSFGLVAIASLGTILSVMTLNILMGAREYATVPLEPLAVQSNSLVGPFLAILPAALRDSFIILSPILIVSLLLQKFLLRLEERAFRRMFKGFIFTLLGLIIFLVAVNGGFMEVGSAIGYRLASLDSKSWLITAAFVLGFLTILAEPAVSVLTQQVEDVTSGAVKRKWVLWALSIGVGGAIALAALRLVVPGLQLWHYLLPGYILALTIMHFVPELFVGMAFDAGGVATGPLTATFLLAFVQGAASAFPGANMLADGFGMIALVFMAPVLTLQTMGFLYQRAARKEEGIVGEY
ncbi:MAG: DUF1538 domain-containing protein [Limnochordia bacterium]